MPGLLRRRLLSRYLRDGQLAADHRRRRLRRGSRRGLGDGLCGRVRNLFFRAEPRRGARLGCERDSRRPRRDLQRWRRGCLRRRRRLRRGARSPRRSGGRSGLGRPGWRRRCRLYSRGVRSRWRCRRGLGRHGPHRRLRLRPRRGLGRRRRGLDRGRRSLNRRLCGRRDRGRDGGCRRRRRRLRGGYGFEGVGPARDCLGGRRRFLHLRRRRPGGHGALGRRLGRPYVRLLRRRRRRGGRRRPGRLHRIGRDGPGRVGQRSRGRRFGRHRFGRHRFGCHRFGRCWVGRGCFDRRRFSGWWFSRGRIGCRRFSRGLRLAGGGVSLGRLGHLRDGRLAFRFLLLGLQRVAWRGGYGRGPCGRGLAALTVGRRLGLRPVRVALLVSRRCRIGLRPDRRRLLGRHRGDRFVA